MRETDPLKLWKNSIGTEGTEEHLFVREDRTGSNKEGHSCLHLCPDTLTFLLGRGWSPQPKSYENPEEKWLEMNFFSFFDRQTSVQSLCCVRGEGD